MCAQLNLCAAPGFFARQEVEAALRLRRAGGPALSISGPLVCRDRRAPLKGPRPRALASRADVDLQPGRNCRVKLAAGAQEWRWPRSLSAARLASLPVLRAASPVVSRFFLSATRFIAEALAVSRPSRPQFIEAPPALGLDVGHLLLANRDAIRRETWSFIARREPAAGRRGEGRRKNATEARRGALERTGHLFSPELIMQSPDAAR